MNDYGFTFDGKNNERLSNGALRIRNVALMKTGILKYNNAEYGIQSNYMTTDALRDLETSGEAVGKPVVLVHPHRESPTGAIDLFENQEAYSTTKVGHIEKVTFDNATGILLGDVLIDVPEGIDELEATKQFRSSAGYKFDYPASKAPQNTVMDGVNVDHIIKKIDYFNHVAARTPNPRMGQKGITTLDNEDIMSIEKTLPKFKSGGLTLDDKDIQYPPEAKEAVGVMLNRIELLQTALEVTTDDAAGKEGERKALESEVANLKKNQEGMLSKDDVDAEWVKRESGAKSLAEAGTVAESYGVKTEGLDLLGVQKAVLSKVHDGVTFDDAEVAGAYKTIQANPEHSKAVALSNGILKKAQETSTAKGGLNFDGMSEREILAATSIN